MEEIAKLHLDNVQRFERLENRMTTLETQFNVAIALGKWLGGLVSALLVGVILAVLFHP